MKHYGALIGRHAGIQGDELIPGPIFATIQAVDSVGYSLLLRFDWPIQYLASSYEFAVPSPRLERDDLSILAEGGVLGCGLICVPIDRFDSNNPFDVTWWRGGGAMITGIEIVGPIDVP